MIEKKLVFIVRRKFRGKYSFKYQSVYGNRSLVLQMNSKIIVFSDGVNKRMTTLSRIDIYFKRKMQMKEQKK